MSKIMDWGNESVNGITNAELIKLQFKAMYAGMISVYESLTHITNLPFTETERSHFRIQALKALADLMETKYSGLTTRNEIEEFLRSLGI